MGKLRKSGLKILVCVGALLVAIWWLMPQDGGEVMQEPLPSESAPAIESAEVVSGTIDPPFDDYFEDEVAEWTPEVGRTTATPTNQPVAMEIEATPVESPLEEYQERFPSSRVIELVRLEPPGQRIPWLDSPTEIHLLELPLPGGESLPVEVVHHEQRSPSRGTFIARAVDWEYSEVIVSYVDEAMTASIILPGQGHFEIAYAGDGLHLLIEVDPDLIAECGGALVPDVEELDEEDKEGASS